MAPSDQHQAVAMRPTLLASVPGAPATEVLILATLERGARLRAAAGDVLQTRGSGLRLLGALGMLLVATIALYGVVHRPATLAHAPLVQAVAPVTARADAGAAMAAPSQSALIHDEAPNPIDALILTRAPALRSGPLAVTAPMLRPLASARGNLGPRRKGADVTPPQGQLGIDADADVSLLSALVAHASGLSDAVDPADRLRERCLRGASADQRCAVHVGARP